MYFEKTSEPLSQRVAGALHKLGLAMKQQAWIQANEEGLSPTQGQILSALSLDGPQTGAELAAKLGVTAPTVSDSVRALVDKGLAVKSPDPRHPRASLVELTTKGRACADKARAWPDFLATAVGALSAAEQEVFLGGLVKMIRTLQEQGLIPVHRMCISCVHFRPHAHDGPMPHHCDFVDAAMADRHFRLDCKEHEEAAAAQRQAVWQLLGG
jgi:DNA-binding MarR family transcriptional regulator